MSRVAGLAFAFLTLLGSSCCCCSSDFFELPEDAQPSDEPAIEAAAREHVAQHQAEIFAGQDAGTRQEGECEVDTGGLAMDLGVAVLSRGHSGGSAAGRVSFDPAACARRVVVIVVKEAAVWTVAGVIVYDRASGAELRRIGTFSPFVEAYDSSGEIDEVF